MKRQLSKVPSTGTTNTSPGRHGKGDELMKWLGVVLKNTSFPRLLPVLASSLTMEQIDELISAKAAGIIAKQEHVKAEEKRADEVGAGKDDDDMKREPCEDLDTKIDETDTETKEEIDDGSAQEEVGKVQSTNSLD